MQQAQEAQPPASWDDWLTSSVAQLRQRSLFRTLRPTVPGLSAVEVRAPGHPCKHAAAAAALLSNPQPRRSPPASPTAAPHPPVHPQAAMSQADIDAFVADRPPASASLPSLADAGDLRIVKLFSLNDYLGLSTHPAVRQAAADAALQCGNGELA